MKAFTYVLLAAALAAPALAVPVAGSCAEADKVIYDRITAAQGQDPADVAAMEECTTAGSSTAVIMECRFKKLGTSDACAACLAETASDDVVGDVFIPCGPAGNAGGDYDMPAVVAGSCADSDNVIYVRVAGAQGQDQAFINATTKCSTADSTGPNATPKATWVMQDCIFKELGMTETCAMCMASSAGDDVAGDVFIPCGPAGNAASTGGGGEQDSPASALRTPLAAFAMLPLAVWL